MSQNEAGQSGGNIGISVGSNADVIRVDVAHGIALNGGGVFAQEAQVTLHDVTVNANEAGLYGGGFYGKNAFCIERLSSLRTV